MSFLSRDNTVVPLSQSYQKRHFVAECFWRRSVRDIVRSNAFKLPFLSPPPKKTRKVDKDDRDPDPLLLFLIFSLSPNFLSSLLPAKRSLNSSQKESRGVQRCKLPELRLGQAPTNFSRLEIVNPGFRF